MTLLQGRVPALLRAGTVTLGFGAQAVPGQALLQKRCLQTTGGALLWIGLASPCRRLAFRRRPPASACSDTPWR